MGETRRVIERETTPEPVGGDDPPAAGTPGARAATSAALRELAVRPSKGMGQNFLTDRRIVARIADAAELAPGATVVEVGPGLGVLTAELLARVGPAGRVIAVELDRRLAAHLRDDLVPEHPAGAALEVVEADVLRRPPPALVPGDAPYALVANLPYNITSAILRHFLDSPRRPARLVVMVQREVAERIVARPPAMSILAVAVQFYGAARIGLHVGRGAFLPRPKVDSAVVRVDTRPRPPLPEEEIPPFFTLVGAGFGQRRKQLLNSLAAGLDLPKPALGAALVAAGIAPDRRAETLAVEDWLALYARLRPQLPSPPSAAS
ncbi:MAG: 16S rRNA (adenine(1518)-N(6)/adenine(1519)-N(6))-dimethyltransferase RsmA [Chloroflexota bacterium]|nr:16S rRNA (adenine(1518)-N(6)/adenine(1519)-N(6))-dimethyltransferase RsmA [Chloroflexota bacterium]